jgi:hypothetical protein
MRPQPSIDTVLQRAAEALERAARETDDAPLAAHVLSPIAGLLRHIADSLDTYVSGRLAEIDRLAALAAASVSVLSEEERGNLERLLDAARSASGYLRTTELDDLADSFHRELIAVQERINAHRDHGSRELAERIWTEQTVGSQPVR